MKKTKSEKVVEFLQSHPLISVRALEITCQLPDATIRAAVAGSRNIPDHHIDVIINALKSYGYKK